MTEDAEDTALVVEVIVVEGEIIGHCIFSVRSSEWAQESRSAGMELSITALPLYWMRKASPRMMLPISCAATWYCLAVLRTRASCAGLTDTTARAPRSPKRAASAGPFSSSLAVALNPFPAKQDSARVTARPPPEMSWADWTLPSAASATRQSIRRLSAMRSMTGGSPATMPPIVFEYSEEENSRAVFSEVGTMYRVL